MHQARHVRREAGFTLIEILVVVVIIAVMTTVAVLSVGVLGKDRGLDDEGDRFTTSSPPPPSRPGSRAATTASGSVPIATR